MLFMLFMLFLVISFPIDTCGNCHANETAWVL